MYGFICNTLQIFGISKFDDVMCVCVRSYVVGVPDAGKRLRIGNLIPPGYIYMHSIYLCTYPHTHTGVPRREPPRCKESVGGQKLGWQHLAAAVMQVRAEMGVGVGCSERRASGSSIEKEGGGEGAGREDGLTYLWQVEILKNSHNSACYSSCYAK